MPKVTIFSDRCKGCGLCTAACPKNIVSLDPEKMNKNGYRPAIVTDPDLCIGCAMCAQMCPDMAIEVER